MISSTVTHSIDPAAFGPPLLGWWAENKRHFPWRDTSDPYELLMAELLLRRTNAPAASAVYTDFLQKYPSAVALSKGKAGDIERICRRLGLNWRAKNVVELARYLRHNCAVLPDTIDGLSELPGVGPYVARAVMVNCHHLKTVPVDTNVVRVLCRFLGLTESDNLRRNKHFQELADSFLGSAPVRFFNFALLDFAASVCRPKEPKCTSCPLAINCKSAGLLARPKITKTSRVL